jgi:hypothetical protein
MSTKKVITDTRKDTDAISKFMEEVEENAKKWDETTARAELVAAFDAWCATEEDECGRPEDEGVSFERLSAAVDAFRSAE